MGAEEQTSNQTWPNFESAAKAKLQSQGVTKLIAREGSLLAANLQMLLEIVKRRYANLPPIRDVLLFLHTGINASLIPQKAAKDFEVVAVDYGEAALGNFIRLF